MAAGHTLACIAQMVRTTNTISDKVTTGTWASMLLPSTMSAVCSIKGKLGLHAGVVLMRLAWNGGAAPNNKHPR